MQCPFATWLPITANYRAGGMSPDIRGFVPHCQVGNGSLQAFFSNPATQASAHFWCSKTGTLEQYVDTQDMAWAEAAGNPYFWSCEFEGQVDEPMTSQQLDMGGRLIAWLYGLHTFPLVVNTSPDGQGITPHYAGGAAWGGHSCPGPTRFQQFDELILATLRYLDEGDDMTPDEMKAVLNDWWTLMAAPGHVLGNITDDLAKLSAKVDALAAAQKSTGAVNVTGTLTLG